MRCDDRLRDSAAIALLTATAGRTLGDSSQGYLTESQATLMSSLVDKGDLHEDTMPFEFLPERNLARRKKRLKDR